MPRPAKDTFDIFGDFIEKLVVVFSKKAYKTYKKKQPEIEEALNRAIARLDKVI